MKGVNQLKLGEILQDKKKNYYLYFGSEVKLIDSNLTVMRAKVSHISKKLEFFLSGYCFQFSHATTLYYNNITAFSEVETERIIKAISCINQNLVKIYFNVNIINRSPYLMKWLLELDHFYSDLLDALMSRFKLRSERSNVSALKFHVSRVSENFVKEIHKANNNG